jgi:hypothetical protein
MAIEHWDIVALLDLDYFQAQVLRYVMRWKDKAGIQDLEKAVHVLQKYVELQKLLKDGKPAMVRALLMDAVEKFNKKEFDPTGAEASDSDATMPPMTTMAEVGPSLLPTLKRLPYQDGEWHRLVVRVKRYDDGEIGVGMVSFISEGGNQAPLRLDGMSEAAK